MWVNQGATTRGDRSSRLSSKSNISKEHQRHLIKIASELGSPGSISNESSKSQRSLSRSTEEHYRHNVSQVQDERLSLSSFKTKSFRNALLHPGAKKISAPMEVNNMPSTVLDEIDSASKTEENSTDIFITLAAPKSSTTTISMSDLYSSGKKRIQPDYSSVIQSSVYDLIEGSIDISDQHQTLLFSEVETLRYKIAYEDHDRNDILICERNAGRYFERCMEREDVPHLYIYFARDILCDTNIS